MNGTARGSKSTRTLPVWGERVALERILRAFSQAELGRLAGEQLGRAVSRDTIANVERGRGKVPDDLRVALANVFEMAPEALFPYPRLVPPAARAPRASRQRPTLGERMSDRAEDGDRAAVA